MNNHGKLCPDKFCPDCCCCDISKCLPDILLPIGSGTEPQTTTFLLRHKTLKLFPPSN